MARQHSYRQHELAADRRGSTTHPKEKRPHLSFAEVARPPIPNFLLVANVELRRTSAVAISILCANSDGTSS
jgi:hypothetical protein